jgi:hypothetical protein
MPTQKGPLVLLYSGFSREPGSSIGHLQAALRNDTPFTFERVSFEMIGYDTSGSKLDLCGHKCIFGVLSPLEPGQVRRIISPADSEYFERALPPRIEWKVLEAKYFIKYDIRTDSVATEKFTILPAFSVTGIGLEFQNKSSDVIEVAWDQSVYIDEDGNASRLIKGNAILANRDHSQPNTVVPPGSKFQETVFPVDRVVQEDGKWVLKPILPDTAYLFDKERFDTLWAKASWVHNVYLPGTKYLVP